MAGDAVTLSRVDANFSIVIISVCPIPKPVCGDRTKCKSRDLHVMQPLPLPPSSGYLQYISRLIRLARHFVPAAVFDPARVLHHTLIQC